MSNKLRVGSVFIMCFTAHGYHSTSFFFPNTQKSFNPIHGFDMCFVIFMNRVQPPCRVHKGIETVAVLVKVAVWVKYNTVYSCLFVNKVEIVPSVFSRVRSKHRVCTKNIAFFWQMFQHDLSRMFLNAEDINNEGAFFAISNVFLKMRYQFLDGRFKTNNGSCHDDNVHLLFQKGIRLGKGHVLGAHGIGHVRVIAPGSHHDFAMFTKRLGNKLTKSTESNDSNGQWFGTQCR
mmetsp:Transcript_8772/g.14049  ORF Transcript_8772/g.14049 Transcript_8772/m.14049 type:complete len:233 (+) Transcript_8772:1477-2175(+)